MTESPRPSELVDSAYWFETNDAPLLHHDLTLADLAHILHLGEMEIIPRPAAQILLQSILELDGDNEFTYEPERGDAFTNRESWLEARAPEAAGYLAAGRARREATTVAFRLLVRRQLLTLAGALCEAESALTELAARHTETWMPDYTYLQPAHPTSFAHYVLGFAFPLLRDSIRLRESFELVNQSPAGIGSINGSALPLKRERLAELLGFDRVIIHTRDAMWQVDAPLVAVEAAATLMLHLDRLAEDLQIFNSEEFGFVRLAGEFTRSSLIMPQKKNPYPLAFIRGSAAILIGRVSELYVAARTPSAQIDNRLVPQGEVPRALDLTIRCVRLMAAVGKTLQVCTEPMARRVEEGFTQATDLAELLMRSHGIDYKAAHRIVGLVIEQLQARNQTAREVTPALLAASAQEVIGRPLKVTADELESLEPAQLVRGRVGIGGAAPERVNEMIAECRASIQAQRAWVAETARRIQAAEAKLAAEAARFAG